MQPCRRLLLALKDLDFTMLWGFFFFGETTESLMLCDDVMLQLAALAVPLCLYLWRRVANATTT